MAVYERKNAWWRVCEQEEEGDNCLDEDKDKLSEREEDVSFDRDVLANVTVSGRAIDYKPGFSTPIAGVDMICNLQFPGEGRRGVGQKFDAE